MSFISHLKTNGECEKFKRLLFHFIGERISVNRDFSLFLPSHCRSETVMVNPPIYTLVYRGSHSPTHRQVAGAGRRLSTSSPQQANFAGGAL